MAQRVRGKGPAHESQHAKLKSAIYKLIGLQVIINGMAALTVYRSKTTSSALMPYSFGTILSDKSRLIWSYGVSLLNFFILVAFLTHLKRKLQKSNKEEDHL